MNLFVSNRVKPENVKFPKPLSKLDWEVVTTNEAFYKAMAKSTVVGNVVLDAFGDEEINGLKCSYALTEITCDKHHALPTVMIIGPDKDIRKSIEDHLARSKKWIDIAKSKGM